MPVVEESVVIARPPHEVFAYIVKAENLPIWVFMTIEAEQIGNGAPGRDAHERSEQGAGEAPGLDFRGDGL